MSSAFTFPPAPNVTASSVAVPCPPGQHQTANGCVDNTPTGPSPTAPYPQAPGPAPTPTTPAPGGGDKPGDCAAQGKVWRADTKQCEFEDARHNAGQDTCGGALPQCPPGQDVWCDFTDAQFKCARSSWSDAELCGRANRIRRDNGKPEK